MIRAPFLIFPLLLTTLPLCAQGKVSFESQIWPILEKRCVECHATPSTGPDGKPKKPKGGVVLDSKDGITTSKKGTLVVAKKPDDSMLYASITLPADHEDRMPPAKKGEPLSKSQTDLIKKWIEEGGELGKWTGKKAEADKADAKPGTDKGKDAGKEKGKKGTPIAQLQAGLQPVPAATLAAFANGPFAVSSLGDDSPLLRVTCAGNSDDVTDKSVEALAPLKAHIAELDLARAHVGDAACAVIATMPRLLTLDLRQTQVGNQGTAKLAACKELRSLNLYGTKVGDYAMAALAELQALENLYVWQTEVSAGAIIRLREAVPGVRVVMANDLPEPMGEGAGNGRRRAGK